MNATLPATCAEAYRAAECTWGTPAAHEISEAAYYECLEVLPPIYGRSEGGGLHGNKRHGRFWISEPTSHEARGAICLECWCEGGGENEFYFCRYSVARSGETDLPPRADWIKHIS